MLGQLRSHNAVDLFLDNCGPLEVSHLLDFLIEDKNYPFKKLLLNGKEMESAKPHQLTPELRKQIQITLLSKKGKIEALMLHDMFKQLAGNPTSITMIATMLQNPMILKSEKNALIDMY